MVIASIVGWLLVFTFTVFISLQIEVVFKHAAKLLNIFLAWDRNRMAIKDSFNSQLNAIKKELFSKMEEVTEKIHGPVLEIGAGGSSNLQFYPKNTQLITIDLNENCKKYLMENLKKNQHVHLDKCLVGNVEDMSGLIEDNSCSCVVSTLLLCSVDQQKTLREIMRVLKPGGCLFFLEHIVEERGTYMRLFQEMFTPIWTSIRAGCSLTCETDVALNESGFHHFSAKVAYRDLPFYICFVKRTYFGSAFKPDN